MSLSDDLLKPIPGENPAGANLRYDPVYDKIKEARREDPFMDPPIHSDWRAVVELTGDAIAKKSKDLQLAAWWTEGMIRRDGVAGLHQGLALMKALVERFWDHLYPEIDDGDTEMRAAPLAWVGSYLDVAMRLVPVNTAGHTYSDLVASRLIPSEEEAESSEEKQAARAEALGDGKIDPEIAEKAFLSTPKAFYKQFIGDLDAAAVLIDQIEKLGDEQLGDAAPGYQKLRGAVREVRGLGSQLLARKLETEPDPPGEESIDLDPRGDDATGGVLSIDPQNRDDAARRIAAAARFLRRESPGNPASYLLLRGFRWGELRAGGSTPDPRLLAAPPTEIRTRLKGLLLDARWPDLIENAEEVMATPIGRGWLDLQRYFLTACDSVGGDYATVADVVRGALRSMLRDVPSLPDSTLMDDLPTANVETRNWLRDQGMIGGASGDDEPDVERPAASADSVDRMLQRLGTSNPQRAIELLMRAVSQEKSERSRFLRRTQAAQIMVDSGMEAVAYPILQDMLGLIDTHQLEDWEAGETMATALGLLYRCMQRMGAEEAAREGIYLRVCRLDPIQAMRFVGSPAQDDGEQPGD